MTPATTAPMRVPGRAERARIIEEAVHSIGMEGLELAAVDAADAAEYVAGRITLDEYGRRTRARYGASETGRGSGRTADGPAASGR